MISKGVIQNVTDGFVTIIAPIDKEYLIDKQDITECEVRFDDGRTITAEQRKKAFALINDIAEWSGHLPHPLKELLKIEYMAKTGCDYFSLSDCDVSTARDFISMLIDFCFEKDVPTYDTLLNRTDDIASICINVLLIANAQYVMQKQKCIMLQGQGSVWVLTGTK